MTETSLSKSAVRPVPIRRMALFGRDFVIGLGVFAVILLATAKMPADDGRGHHQMFLSSAYAAPMLTLAAKAPADLQPSTVYRSTDRGEARAILGIAFASLVAFNLGMLRHLRRVYASPR